MTVKLHNAATVTLHAVWCMGGSATVAELQQLHGFCSMARRDIFRVFDALETRGLMSSALVIGTHTDGDILAWTVTRAGVLALRDAGFETGGP